MYLFVPYIKGMKDGTILTRMVGYYSLAISMSLKRKDFQGEDPERQDIEQQNSSHQAVQGELPSLSQKAAAR